MGILIGRVRRFIAPLVGITLAAFVLGTPLTAMATAAQIYFDVSLNLPGACIWIHGPANTSIDFVWRDADGNLKGQASGNTGGGAFPFCPGDYSGISALVGDRFKASFSGYTRKWVVPEFTLEIDRVTNIFRGTAPAGRTVRLGYTTSPLDDVQQNHSIRVGQDGTWSYDPHDDIVGGWWSGQLGWSSPNGDHLSVYATAPLVTVTLGKAAFYGTTAPLADVSVSLDGGAKAVGDATAGVSGDFSGKFRHDGSAVQIAAGDHLVGTSVAADLDWIVPNITGSADKDADVINGRCFDAGTSSGIWWVRVARSGHVRGYALGLVIDQDGNFTADFSDPHGSPGYNPANIKSGDGIIIGCQQTTGDWVQLKFTVP